MPDEKYLSKWSGENIDRAYEIIKDLNIGDMNKLTYVDSNGNLKATSFTKEKIGLLDTVSWSAKPSNNFVIKNENGNIALSNYNYYSFVGYWDSGATTGPEQCLSSFYIDSSGSVPKYYVKNTGITTSQLTTSFSDIEDLKAAIGSGGGSESLNSRVTILENNVSNLSGDVDVIQGQIGTPIQEGSILYRLAQIDNTLTTKADTNYVNTALAAKADISYVDTALATKANTSDVNTALATKADLTNANQIITANKIIVDEVSSKSNRYLDIRSDGSINFYSDYFWFAKDANSNSYVVIDGQITEVHPEATLKSRVKLIRDRSGVISEVVDTGNADSLLGLSNKEDIINKTTSISSSSTNTQYPSAKAVYDYISGTDDGTNWTSLTIGNTTRAIPSGGGGGTTVSGTNDGTNWTTITIGASTYNIPNNGSVTISQVQVNDPAKVPSSALMYSVNSRVVELETQLAAALQEINSLKQRVSTIEGDYVVAMDEHTEVEVSGNNIKFISDVTTSGNEISFTQNSTHLDGNDILL